MSDSPKATIQEVSSQQPTQQEEQHENNKASLEESQHPVNTHNNPASMDLPRSQNLSPEPRASERDQTQATISDEILEQM